MAACLIRTKIAAWKPAALSTVPRQHHDALGMKQLLLPIRPGPVRPLRPPRFFCPVHCLSSQQLSRTTADVSPSAERGTNTRRLHTTGITQLDSPLPGILVALRALDVSVRKVVKYMMKPSADRDIVDLPSKPSTHSLQSRECDVKDLQSMFDSLRKRRKAHKVVVVSITGRLGLGKTLLAREYGATFHQRHAGSHFKSVFVGTIKATDNHTLLQSFIELAQMLRCEIEQQLKAYSSGQIEQLRFLQLLSVAVGTELSRRRWLLIVDDLSKVTSMWPQLGFEGWGKGYVLVTTRDRTLVEHSNPSANEMVLNKGMSVKDAVALLEKVSGVKGDGAYEVVNALGRNPHTIARYMHVAASRINV